MSSVWVSHTCCFEQTLLGSKGGDHAEVDGGRSVTKGEQLIVLVQPPFWAGSGIIVQMISIRQYLRRKGKGRLWKLAFDANRQTS